jgi:hypothetical protein
MGSSHSLSRDIVTLNSLRYSTSTSSLYLITEFGLVKHSKITVEKAFFFIFMPFFAAMSVLGPKKRKRHVTGYTFFP